MSCGQRRPPRSSAYGRAVAGPVIDYLRLGRGAAGRADVGTLVPRLVEAFTGFRSERARARIMARSSASMTNRRRPMLSFAIFGQRSDRGRAFARSGRGRSFRRNPDLAFLERCGPTPKEAGPTVEPRRLKLLRLARSARWWAAGLGKGVLATGPVEVHPTLIRRSEPWFPQNVVTQALAVPPTDAVNGCAPAGSRFGVPTLRWTLVRSAARASSSLITRRAYPRHLRRARAEPLAASPLGCSSSRLGEVRFDVPRVCSPRG